MRSEFVQLFWPADHIEIVYNALRTEPKQYNVNTRKKYTMVLEGEYYKYVSLLMENNFAVYWSHFG